MGWWHFTLIGFGKSAHEMPHGIGHIPGSRRFQAANDESWKA